MAIKGKKTKFDVYADVAFVRKVSKYDKETGRLVYDDDGKIVVKRREIRHATIDVVVGDGYESLSIKEAERAVKLLRKAIAKARASEEKILKSEEELSKD